MKACIMLHSFLFYLKFFFLRKFLFFISSYVFDHIVCEGPKRGSGIGTGVGIGLIPIGETDKENYKHKSGEMEKEMDEEKEKEKEKERDDEDHVDVYIADNAIDLGGLKQVKKIILYSCFSSLYIIKKI